MNKYFSYDSMRLWERDAWDDKISPANILLRYMTQNALGRVPARRREDTAPPDDAIFSEKFKGYVFPDVLRFWEARKMHFQCDEAGGVRWLALVPYKTLCGENHDPRILFALSDRDLSDPYWAMDAQCEYRDYGEMLAETEDMLIVVAADGPSKIDLAILILRELAQRFNVNYEALYMDVSDFVKAGMPLSQVPGFRYCDKSGKPTDPDAAIERFGRLGIPALSISGQWVSKDSLEFANFTPGRIGAVPFCYDRLIHSIAGEKMADAMRIEFDYDAADEPGLQALLSEMGLVYGYHEYENRGWVTLAPRSAQYAPEQKLPCMVILQEIAKVDPRSIPSAFSLWFEYLKIAAQGQLMLLFFVLEDPDSNDLLVRILREAKNRYAFLDEDRVYITGHSHNAQYALEFARRHPELLAGVATMGNPHGLGIRRDAIRLTEDMVERMRRARIPLINIDGQFENGYSCAALSADERKYLPPEERVKTWNTRLRAYDCAKKSPDEILAAQNSPELATRMLGVPVDRAEVAYVMGDECYIGDVKSRDGEVYLRVVTIAGLPHATSAHMPWLSWSFLRRFTRDAHGSGVVNAYHRKRGRED